MLNNTTLYCSGSRELLKKAIIICNDCLNTGEEKTKKNIGRCSISLVIFVSPRSEEMLDVVCSFFFLNNSYPKEDRYESRETKRGVVQRARGVLPSLQEGVVVSAGEGR